MPVLLLVGAGHAHLYVVKHAVELVAAGYRVHLLAPRFFDYSGVASATAAGAVRSGAGRINVPALASASSVEFHEGSLESLHPEARIAVTSDGDRLSYDVLSVNIGSVVRSDVVLVRLVESGMLIGADLPEGARKQIVRLLAARAWWRSPGAWCGTSGSDSWPARTTLRCPTMSPCSPPG